MLNSMYELYVNCTVCYSHRDLFSFWEGTLVPTSAKIVMLYNTSTCLPGLQNSSLYWDGFRSYFLEFGHGYLCFLVGTRFVGTALTHKAKSVTFCILGGMLTQFEGGVMGSFYQLHGCYGLLRLRLCLLGWEQGLSGSVWLRLLL